MKLNPLDIRRQQFARKTFGGYDTDEVDGFMKQLADQWEDALDEVRAATDRLQETENKLRHYERVEMALQEALESTRESGRRAEALADQKARLIIDEAEMRARQIVQDAERDRHDLRQDLVTLTSRQTEIGARLRGFLLSELEILAQFQGDDPVGFIKLQPAGQAVEARSLDAPVEPSRLVPHDARHGDARPSPVPEPELHPAMPEPHPSPGAEADATGWQVPAGASEPPAVPAEAPARASWPAETGTPPREPDAPTVAHDIQPDPPAPMPPAADPIPAWPPTPTPAPPPAPAGIPAWAADLPTESPVEPSGSSWDLRSLVTGSEDNVAGSEAERERIRRILDDLD